MSGRQKLIVVVLAAGLGVLLFLMPRQSHNVRSEADQRIELRAGLSPLDSALEMVNGPAPMEGIMKLRGLADGEGSPDSVRLRANIYLGMFAIQTAQTDKARERFDAAMALDSTFAEAHWQLGHLEMEEGNFNKAEGLFRRAIELDPEHYANAWFMLGKSKELQGDTIGALECYRTFEPLNTDTAVDLRLKEIIAGLETALNKQN